MKNKISNYISKVNKTRANQNIDVKNYAENIILCEKSMNELKKIYWHEKELIIAIPLLISSATTFELVEILTVHIIYLRKHIKELETKFPFIDKLEISKIA